jgi:hypothetical protein
VSAPPEAWEAVLQARLLAEEATAEPPPVPALLEAWEGRPPERLLAEETRVGWLQAQAVGVQEAALRARWPVVRATGEPPRVLLEAWDAAPRARSLAGTAVGAVRAPVPYRQTAVRCRPSC